MIEEAIDNREQKQKQREKEYERKRDAKHRDRQLYHMRHTNDYEALGIPIGETPPPPPSLHPPLCPIGWSELPMDYGRGLSAGGMYQVSQGLSSARHL